MNAFVWKLVQSSVFPWYQPYQCFCENTQRVALQRRLPEDDQWVVPHNLYLTLFSPASLNVMPFDPTRGSDHARSLSLFFSPFTSPLPPPCLNRKFRNQSLGHTQQSTAQSQRSGTYFLETVADGLKNWLKARTVGISMAFNRLLSFHVVRSTRPCQYVPACFIGKKEYRNLRDPGHIEKCPQYPDPQYHPLASSRSRSISRRSLSKSGDGELLLIRVRCTT